MLILSSTLIFLISQAHTLLVEDWLADYDDSNNSIPSLNSHDTRQAYPSVQINPGQSINSFTPSQLSICIGGFSVDKSGNSVCNQDSSKNQRIAYEVDCKFPFQYKGVWYDNCIKVDSVNFWCSLDKIFNGKFAFCANSCPILSKRLLNMMDYGKMHSNCLQPKTGVSPLFPTDAQAQIIVAAHNQIRSRVTFASDLRVIEYDLDVARTAQRKAETCTFSHDCANCRKLPNNSTLGIGQNAYMAWGDIGSDLNSIWQKIIDSWASEIKDFRYGGPHSGIVGHYTQIVNNLVSRVGCGAARCGNEFYAYCNYVGAQMDTNKPYILGTASCNMCPSSRCINNLCECKKVCQNGGILSQWI